MSRAGTGEGAMSLTEKINQLRELEAKATPGEWVMQPSPDEQATFIIAEDLGGLVGAALPWPTEIADNDYSRVDANASLIVALRNALPALLDAAALAKQDRLRMLDEIARRRRAEHDTRRAEAERDRLRERVAALEAGLLDACANLTGAASAYRKHAMRAREVGRAQADPFFTTRVDDFDRAADRARALLTPETTNDQR